MIDYTQLAPRERQAVCVDCRRMLMVTGEADDPIADAVCPMCLRERAWRFWAMATPAVCPRCQGNGSVPDPEYDPFVQETWTGDACPLCRGEGQVPAFEVEEDLGPEWTA